MNSININRQCKDYIRNEFPSQFDDDNSNWWGRGGNWWNRRLVLRSPGARDFDPKGQIRYVLRYLGQQDIAYVELHINKDADGEDFSDLLAELRQRCPDCDDFCWVGEDRERYRYNHLICGWNDARQAFSAIMAKTGELIERFFREEQAISRFEVSSMQLNLSGEEVNLETLSLHQVLSLKLHIPDYQRIYCWDEKTLYTLWNDIQEISPNENIGSAQLFCNASRSILTSLTASNASSHCRCSLRSCTPTGFRCYWSATSRSWPRSISPTTNT